MHPIKPPPLSPRQGWLLLALLWLAGLYLRLPVLAAAPLGGEIARDLGLGQSGIGALTTLPVLMLGIGAIPAARLVRRGGVRRALMAGITVMALASALRALAPPAALLFAATAAMGLGIAAMQAALPPLTRTWSPASPALGSTVYLNGMVVGELLGAGLTLPLFEGPGGGEWRTTLVLWSLPALLIAAALLLPRTPASPTAIEAATRAPRMPWRTGALWQLGLSLASAVVVFLATNAWMESVLARRGEPERLALMMLLYNACPLAASLASLAIGRRLFDHPRTSQAVALMGALGLAGFLWLPGPLGLAAALVSALGATFQMIVVLSLPPRRVGGETLHQLTSGMFTVSYGLAFALPLAGGLIADALNRPLLALLPVLGLALLSVALRPERASLAPDASTPAA